MRRLFSESSVAETVAVAHTCPDTLWPPISSPTRAERSKLTRLPKSSVPRLVALSVSTIMSKLSLSPSIVVTCHTILNHTGSAIVCTKSKCCTLSTWYHMVDHRNPRRLSMKCSALMSQTAGKAAKLFCRACSLCSSAFGYAEYTRGEAHREAGTVDGHAGANLYAGHAAAGELYVNAPEILLLMHPHHFPLPLDNA